MNALKEILLPSLAGNLGAVVAHGEVGYWDEILLYGGGIVLLTIIFFGLLLSRRLKPDLEEGKEDQKEKAGK